MTTARLFLLALTLLTCPALANADSAVSSDPTTASGKILGGIESNPGAWPWIAALLDSGNPDMYQAQFCSGVLIDETWVLTAAHCVHDQSAAELQVAVGVFDLGSFSGSRIQVRSVRVHPGYNTGTQRNDIALLELSRSVDQPTVTLFSGESEDNTPASLLGTMMVAMGWGMADGSTRWYYPEKLRQVNLPVVADSNCNYSTPLVDSQVCAGYSNGRDVCNGDSGGPLVTQIDDQWVHAGLVSYGASCRDAFGWYGVYTRTSAYVDWIQGYVPNARFTSSASVTPPGSSANLQWLMLLLNL